MHQSALLYLCAPAPIYRSYIFSDTSSLAVSTPFLARMLSMFRIRLLALYLIAARTCAGRTRVLGLYAVPERRPPTSARFVAYAFLSSFSPVLGVALRVLQARDVPQASEAPCPWSRFVAAFLYPLLLYPQ